MEKILNNLEETRGFAKKLAGELKPGRVVAIYGDLGAGKTTLVQFLAKELGVKTLVTSPTFVIQKNYPLKSFELVHIDCYRLHDSADANGLGFLELFSDPKKLVLVEWAERIENLLPGKTVRIKIDELDGDRRKIEVI